MYNPRDCLDLYLLRLRRQVTRRLYRAEQN